jgi:hypothetical protein
MDAPELRLWHVKRQLDQERAQRIRFEHEARQLRLDLTRAKRIIATMRQQQSKPPERAA